jgi:hypothetical protein
LKKKGNKLNYNIINRLAAIAIMKMYLIPNNNGYFMFNEILFSFFRYNFHNKLSQSRLNTAGMIDVQKAENET